MSEAAPFNGTSSDWLSITRNAFKDGRTYFDAGIRAEIERDVRQFQGRHAADSKYESDLYRKKSRFFRPKTRATIRKNEAVAAAAFFSNHDVVEITPWDDSDPMQMASAALHKELLNLRLKRSIPWFQISMGAYQEAQAVGVVCSHQDWRFNPKRKIDQPMIELVPVENLVFSPSAHWYDVINTTPFLIHMIPMYVKDVQARMKKPQHSSDKPRWNQLDDSVILQAVKSYSDSINLERNRGRADPQSAATSLTPYQLVWVYRTIADIDGDDYVWYSLGESELLTNGVPLASAYWHGLRPYTMGFAIIEAHKVYPPGVSRITRDLIAEINDTANLRNENVKLALNKRYFAKRGAQVDITSLTRSVAASVTLMNKPGGTDPDVVTQEFKDVTRSSYEEQDRLEQSFDEIAGSYTPSTAGDSDDLGKKVGGAELLTEDKNQIQGYQLRTFVETWVEPTLHQVMRLEQCYETDPQILELCGRKANIAEDHNISEITDKLLMQDLSLIVHVGIGATSPRKQLENLIYALTTLENVLKDGTLDKYNLDVKTLMDEVFGKLGYKSSERFFKWGNEDPMVAQLKMQVQQLTQELANKSDPPELIAAKVDELRARIKKILAETFGRNVEALFGSMQAAEVVAAVPAVGPVADTIAKAAGYENPQPPGVDPGISNPTTDAASQAPPSGLSFAKNGVADKMGTRDTGINLHPGSAAQPALPAGVPHNTHPTFPANTVSAEAGTDRGIQGGR